MPDDNRFAGLSEAVEEDDPDPGDGSDDDAATEADSSDGTDATAKTESAAAGADTGSAADAERTDSGTGATSDAGDGGSDAGSDVDSSDDDPTAFPFDATEKKTVYVRPETLDEMEDARALVDAQLRTDHDVRDLTGREFYDAAFRLAAADTDGLIEEILAAREE